LKGAYAVFAVTNFWENPKADVEIQQGKNIADVSKVRFLLTPGPPKLFD
jgi:hypothetical protein